MKHFIEGDDREQGILFPDHLEDFVGLNGPDNPCRFIGPLGHSLNAREGSDSNSRQATKPC